MERRLEKSESENKELRTRLRGMEIQIQETAQKEFSCMMEISGIKNKEVDAKIVTGKVLEKAGFSPAAVKTKVEKITKAVGESKVEKTVISVRFESQEVRNEVLSKIKKDKVYANLPINSDGTFIQINESLSPYYKKLFFEARRVKIEKKYSFLWIKDGKILLKKTEQAKTMRISCMDDLGKL
ncbi:hypothetical protein M8J75_016177 [Diaphorina citri]|nr:hypothetical protein M8J75_016177 [Diaphorina citri]